MWNLLELLKHRKYAGEEAKKNEVVAMLHVMRGKSAALAWDWKGAREGDVASLFEYARIETEWNELAKWRKATHIVVLLSVDAPGSPFRHVADGYLYMGVLKNNGRVAGFGPKDGGTVERRAWTMDWVEEEKDGRHLLVNPQMRKVPRGWSFNLSGSDYAKASNFEFFGRTDARVSVETPKKLRGFQLSLTDLKDRIEMSNWSEFLDAAGIYLIQVFDPERSVFYRYVGKAKTFKGRWRDYAISDGTGAGTASQDDTGNKYLTELRCKDERSFKENWRIQIVRVCDTDEIDDLEREVKESLCTYHPSVQGERFNGYRSALGLNGN
jgi:hypothetical protein